jgi:Do/DeqQ family serine protease
MRKTWLIFSQAVTVSLAVLFVVATLKPDWLGRSGSKPLPTVVSVFTAPEAPGAAASGSASSSLSAAARRASPAVVSISASRPRGGNPHAGDPFFDFYFGQRGQQRPQASFGSGVIASPEGYVLTNNHVIEGSDEIEVQLSDGRQTIAKVVGGDPETDVAVLKIDLDQLPAITFGDAEALQVGDAVLAIGNPFGIGQTVTAGIVSALGRNGLGLNTFENFIQTDAAINRGNSGGALVDINGNLVGINTAIYSQTGGSVGIGFAIPASMARQVMESLVRDGTVKRGWIGVESGELTEELASSLNLPIRQGVLVSGVLQNGPASQGGMRPGDIVTQVAGKPVRNSMQLRDAVSALPPGQGASLDIQRGQQALQLTVTIGQRPRLDDLPRR